MATRKQSVDDVAEVAEVNRVTIEASLQNIGPDIIPRVSRGQRSPHYSARPLAAVLTSLASPSPIKADHAVRTFWGLRKADIDSFDMGETFEAWLINQVTEASNPELRKNMEQDAEADNRLQAWFCLSPPSISIHPTLRGGYLAHGVKFLPEVRTRENMRRRGVETVVKLDLTVLLKVAGDLLADTLARDPNVSLLPPDASSAKNAKDAEQNKTTPKTTKAAEPASSNGPQLSSRSASRAYPALAQTAHAHTTQSTGEEGSNQSASGSPRRVSQVCRHPKTPRTRNHDATYWTAAPP